MQDKDSPCRDPDESAGPDSDPKERDIYSVVYILRSTEV